MARHIANATTDNRNIKCCYTETPLRTIGMRDTATTMRINIAARERGTAEATVNGEVATTAKICNESRDVVE